MTQTLQGSLVTKDPFHIPGYDGHVPQLAYKCGHRFATTTHALLTNPEVDKSPVSVLANIQQDPRNSGLKPDETRKKIIHNRTASWGDQRLLYPLVPGYTGEIPLVNDYCGNTYAKTGLLAISDFEVSQRGRRYKKAELKAINQLQAGKPVHENYVIPSTALPPLKTRHPMPLQKIREDMLDYVPNNSFDTKLSPYKLRKDDREKRFISGYMGFVPRAHELFGKDYESITHTALNRFTDDLERQGVVLSTPVEVNRASPPETWRPTIYPTESGLVPRYTGHVPGGKYHFGKTFYESSKDARNKFSPEKMPESLQQRALVIP